MPSHQSPDRDACDDALASGSEASAATGALDSQVATQAQHSRHGWHSISQPTEMPAITR